MANHLASIFGTEKDRVNCPFYFKIGWVYTAVRQAKQSTWLRRQTVAQTFPACPPTICLVHASTPCSTLRPQPCHLHGPHPPHTQTLPFPPRSACRHGDRCSRLHNRPTISPTLLLQNMYQNPILNAPLGPDGLPVPVDPKKVQEFFEVSGHAAAPAEPRGERFFALLYWR